MADFFALHSQQAISKRPLTLMTCTPVRMVAASVMGSLSFYATFWQFFSCVKRVMIGVGGDHWVAIYSNFIPSWSLLMILKNSHHDMEGGVVNIPILRGVPSICEWYYLVV